MNEPKIVQFWDAPNWECCSNPSVHLKYSSDDDNKYRVYNKSLCCGNCGKVIREYGYVDYRSDDEKRGSW